MMKRFAFCLVAMSMGVSAFAQKLPSESIELKIGQTLQSKSGDQLEIHLIESTDASALFLYERKSGGVDVSIAAEMVDDQETAVRQGLDWIAKTLVDSSACQKPEVIGDVAYASLRERLTTQNLKVFDFLFRDFNRMKNQLNQGLDQQKVKTLQSAKDGEKLVAEELLYIKQATPQITQLRNQNKTTEADELELQVSQMNAQIKELRADDRTIKGLSESKIDFHDLTQFTLQEIQRYQKSVTTKP